MMQQIENRDKELEMLAIIRLQIKSEISGVIDGDCTIPYPVSVKNTWTEVFQLLNIRFDPNRHQLKGHGQFVDDLTSRIFAYCKQYKTNRATYHVKIVARATPRVEKLKKNRRNVTSRQKTSPTPTAFQKGKIQLRQVEQKQTSPIQQPRQTRSQRRGKLEPSPNGHTDVAQKRKRGTEGHNLFTSSPLNPHAISEEEREGTSAGYKLQMAPQQVKNNGPIKGKEFGGHTSAMSSQIEQQAQMVYRDETTQAGDIPRSDEFPLKPKILKYLTNHCSNRDMLLIRNELTGLKLALKFQALNRLVPFTAGFLQNTFVDGHKYDEDEED